MSAYGTFGDEITLRAAAEFFNKASTASVRFARCSTETKEEWWQHGKNYTKHWIVFWTGYRSQENIEQERWNKSWIELYLLLYGWYVIKNVWWRREQ